MEGRQERRRGEVGERQPSNSSFFTNSPLVQGHVGDHPTSSLNLWADNNKSVLMSSSPSQPSSPSSLRVSKEGEERNQSNGGSALGFTSLVGSAISMVLTPLKRKGRATTGGGILGSWSSSAPPSLSTTPLAVKEAQPSIDSDERMEGIQDPFHYSRKVKSPPSQMSNSPSLSSPKFNGSTTRKTPQSPMPNLAMMDQDTLRSHSSSSSRQQRSQNDQFGPTQYSHSKFLAEYFARKGDAPITAQDLKLVADAVDPEHIAAARKSNALLESISRVSPAPVSDLQSPAYDHGTGSRKTSTSASPQPPTQMLSFHMGNGDFSTYKFSAGPGIKGGVRKPASYQGTGMNRRVFNRPAGRKIGLPPIVPQLSNHSNGLLNNIQYQETLQVQSGIAPADDEDSSMMEVTPVVTPSRRQLPTYSPSDSGKARVSKAASMILEELESTDKFSTASSRPPFKFKAPLASENPFTQPIKRHKPDVVVEAKVDDGEASLKLGAEIEAVKQKVAQAMSTPAKEKKKVELHAMAVDAVFAPVVVAQHFTPQSSKSSEDLYPKVVDKSDISIKKGPKLMEVDIGKPVAPSSRMEPERADITKPLEMQISSPFKVAPIVPMATFVKHVEPAKVPVVFIFPTVPDLTFLSPEWRVELDKIQNRVSFNNQAFKFDLQGNVTSVATDDVMDHDGVPLVKTASPNPVAAAFDWGSAGIAKPTHKPGWTCDACMVSNGESAVQCISCNTDRPGTKPASPKPATTGFDWVSAGIAKPTPKPGWTCDACMVSNGESAVQCISCNTDRPGTKPASPKPATTGFDWGSAGIAKPTPKPGWTCDACMVSNGESAVQCISCNTDRPGTKPASPKPATTGFDWGSAGIAKPTPKPGWTCDACMVSNGESAVQCISCNTDRPGTKPASPKPATTGFDWGSAGIAKPTPKPGWTCDACMVSNGESAVQCISCNTDRPGTKPASPKPATTGFDWGSAGIAKPTPKPGWTCDACMVSNGESAVQCISCNTDRPGVQSSSEKAVVAPFTFGTQAKPANFSTSALSTFSLPVKSEQPNDKVDPPALFKFGSSSNAPTFSLGSTVKLEKEAGSAVLAVVNPTGPVFSFGSSSSAPTFSFGASARSSELDTAPKMNLSSMASQAPPASSNAPWLAFGSNPFGGHTITPSFGTPGGTNTGTHVPAFKPATFAFTSGTTSLAEWVCNSCSTKNGQSLNACSSCSLPKPTSSPSNTLNSTAIPFGQAAPSVSLGFTFGPGTPSSK